MNQNSTRDGTEVTVRNSSRVRSLLTASDVLQSYLYWVERTTISTFLDRQCAGTLKSWLGSGDGLNQIKSVDNETKALSPDGAPR